MQAHFQHFSSDSDVIVSNGMLLEKKGKVELFYLFSDFFVNIWMLLQLRFLANFKVERKKSAEIKNKGIVSTALNEQPMQRLCIMYTITS